MPYARPLVLLLAGTGLLVASPARAEEPKPAPAAAEPERATIPWVKVWADAKAQAKREKKDLLIDFTGSDWCTWCIRLEEEILSRPKFLESATKKFVFVFLDFPEDPELKKAVADPKLNESLKQEFHVGGFPSIVLANADGLPYASTGYQRMEPEEYATHLDGLWSGGQKVAALLARGKQDLEVLKQGFEVLAQTDFLGLPGYAWVVDHAEKQDPDGKKGLKALVETERARQRAAAEERALIKLARESAPDKRAEAVYGFLKTSKDLRGSTLWQASMMVASWLLEKKEFAEAKRFFQLPLRDPEIAANEKAQAAVAEALKSVDEAANPKPDEPASDPKAPEEPQAPADPKSPK